MEKAQSLRIEIKININTLKNKRAIGKNTEERNNMPSCMVKSNSLPYETVHLYNLPFEGCFSQFEIP